MTEEILAPLAGKIVKINLEVGAKVEEDDEALIIEAMKMETPVFVPCDGTVKEVRVKEGDSVEEEDVLAIIT
ncbi:MULTISPECIES: acetyl-CoA carboxylase biotin carboxyl carrier protein subunit [Desulfococcus]|jgi:biotin carboxyl carrier protein|uniref:Biotin/lipoyl attachment domain-containing protein n=1 Tax=Desulfococcus multivorans DSM 2059 TaxID=1121405 RepID=S7TRD9_DESML|nr:acetyl-CoA carboxylase biotin carboxyl carrier protein subunit [Desulfococcus multivorans]AOY60591.1 putative biotin/lipoyl attachment protein [Desulfococcus multivorans]AQV02685.1 acetyl-CoA carboxylase biotin carboxyl carrier protein subunit [Desulfococcus multivorans]EPR39702.1 biotin/lipoyl attachment domain-containing protein [Desulfococcus multivorans DSM 2059]SKA04381.1 acetyl-CoA carboxylase biotin carboxyl carrier protein [Desulfococcus multivorans DSM 2059]